MSILNGCGGGGSASASSLPIVATAQPAVQTTPSPGSTATPSPKPPVQPATIPMHIATWVLDEYWGEGAAASSGQVQTYATYAQGGLGDAKARADCASTPKSCSSVWYVDANFQYQGSACPINPDAKFLAAADETWFVHEAGYSDAAHRVRGTYTQSCAGVQSTIPVYLANHASRAVGSWFQSYLQQNAHDWDAYFMDDTSTSVLNQTYGPGGGFCQDSSPNHWCSSTQEYPNDSAVTAAHVALAQALDHRDGTPMRVFFNGVDFNGATPLNMQLMTLAPGRFVGAACEGCVVSNGTLRPAMYAPVLNAMAIADATPDGSFIEISTGSAPAGSSAQIAQRLVTTAMAWLGYAEGHTIVQANLESQTHNLAIWPEDQIYPAAPLQSMRSGASDIAVAPGVYRREFASCYDARSPIGGCAALVNATSAPVTFNPAWLSATYTQAVTLSGGDVGSGGSAVLTPLAMPATIAPGAGMLLVR